MSQLDVVKESIAYLKFWLGILVLLNISLVSWFLTKASPLPSFSTYISVFGIFAITVSAFFIHKKVEYLIATLRGL